jgi:wobble nucleotide-excising tRNase
MFKQLNEIRNYGIFSHYDGDEVDLPDFAKRNLIYGWNYSGKTTLSRIFQSFENGSPHDAFGDGIFELTLEDGRTIDHTQLNELPFPVRVFNADYVENNLSWQEGVDPIFMVGEENIALENEWDKIGSWLDRRESFVDTLRSRSDQLQKHLQKEATKTARRIREDLAVTPFNRSPHLRKAIKKIGSDYTDYLLSKEERQTARQTLAAEERDTVPTINNLPSKASLYDAVTEALPKTPQQEVVKRLTEAPEVEDWVRQGLPLHENTDSCHFCDQPLPDDLLDTLNGHFSEAYQDLQNELDSLIEDLEAAKVDLDFISAANLYQSFRDSYNAERTRCENLADAVNSELDELISHLKKKQKHLSGSYPTGSLPSRHQDRSQLNDAIENINQILSKHNRRTTEHDASRERARERLLRHEAALYLKETNYFENKEKIANLADREERWNDRIEELKERRNQIRRRLADEVQGAEEINRYMSQYFGANNIRVAVTSEDRYVLKRDSQKARNLSEGERTAIALSYFCASLEERDLSLDNTILYLDDPVSSLDSNHVFNTFGIIKNIGSDCRQLFISTHNYEFFRLCKRDSFFHEKTVQGKQRGSWYLLRRTKERNSELIDLPDVLRKYSSEYHYLFDLIYSYKESPEEYSHLLPMMPNILRKILETYTSFRFPDLAGNQLQALQRLMPKDKDTRTQIYKFINVRSHSDSMGYGRDFPQLAECKQIVENTLEALANNDQEHLDAMVALIKPDGNQ